MKFAIDAGLSLPRLVAHGGVLGLLARVWVCVRPWGALGNVRQIASLMHPNHPATKGKLAACRPGRAYLRGVWYQEACIVPKLARFPPCQTGTQLLKIMLWSAWGAEVLTISRPRIPRTMPACPPRLAWPCHQWPNAWVLACPTTCLDLPNPTTSGRDAGIPGPADLPSLATSGPDACVLVACRPPFTCLRLPTLAQPSTHVAALTSRFAQRQPLAWACLALPPVAWMPEFTG